MTNSKSLIPPEEQSSTDLKQQAAENIPAWLLAITESAGDVPMEEPKEVPECKNSNSN